MSELRVPLKDRLRPVTSPTSVARMWHRIEARVRVGERPPSRRFFGSDNRRVGWLVACAILLSMGVAAAARVLHVRTHARPVNPTFSAQAAASSRLRSSVDRRGSAFPPNAVEAAAAPFAPSSASPLAQTGSPTSSWKDWAQRGQNAKAYAELGPGGIERAAQAAAVGDLLVLADVARLSGHPREAVNPLERVVQKHAGDSRAPLAAFMLGRVQLDSLGAPAAGARAFERAIALGLPGGLAEDAYAGVVESRARAGERSGARAAYAEYLAKYPGGRRGKELQRWIAAP
jgi:hypothetical protein